MGLTPRSERGDGSKGGGAMEILPLGSGGVVEIPQKGIRWGAAGLWK